MQLYFGADDLPFVVTWLGNTGNPDVQRTYTSFSKLAEDQANSRIWGGIHFRFESEASREMCPKVAEWVYANYMRPLRVPHAF